MRRTHLRGYTNILQRLLVYAGWGSNLGLVMRQRIGFRTPAPSLCMHGSPVRGELVMGHIGSTSAQYAYL
jgi:hypothetical protein